jgi:2,3-dihydroxybenzoate-AMP ligase
VNRGGEKIAAEEIEAHLLCHPDVREAAVIAVDDEYLGEASCAFLVPVPGTRLTVAEIKRFMSGRGVAAVKVPDRVHFVSSLPKTTVGKLDKRALGQRAGAATANMQTRG